MSADENKRRLIEVIRARSYGTGVEITLASGRTSNFYFNLKPTMMHPEGAHLIGELIIDRVVTMGAEAIGGLEMGAVPLATAATAASHRRGAPIPAFFVRKETKAHGTKSLIEGLTKDESLAGKKVMILEDVTTTGGSSMKACEVLREAGAELLGVVTVVDREEGAAEAFAQAGIAFMPILRHRDFT